MATSTSTTQAQTLVPATVDFKIAGDTIALLDAQLSLRFVNSSQYDECMTNAGKKSYVLKKGTTVTPDGEITISLIKTPDGKQDAHIKKLQDYLKLATVNSDPEKYKKDVSVEFSNSGSDEFLNLKFEGYVSEFNTQSPDLTNFLQYEAKIEIYATDTITLTSK